MGDRLVTVQTAQEPISDPAEARGCTMPQGLGLVHMIDQDHSQDYLEEESRHRKMDDFHVQGWLDHIQDSTGDKGCQHQEAG